MIILQNKNKATAKTRKETENKTKTLLLVHSAERKSLQHPTSNMPVAAAPAAQKSQPILYLLLVVGMLILYGQQSAHVRSNAVAHHVLTTPPAANHVHGSPSPANSASSNSEESEKLIAELTKRVKELDYELKTNTATMKKNDCVQKPQANTKKVKAGSVELTALRAENKKLLQMIGKSVSAENAGGINPLDVNVTRIQLAQALRWSRKEASLLLKRTKALMVDQSTLEQKMLKLRANQASGISSSATSSSPPASVPLTTVKSASSTQCSVKAFTWVKPSTDARYEGEGQ